ncbi:EAL domain-containing protein [Pantoea sp. Al-1710]|uniref:EAL domain-containing protein n=1 Tax=Candidatus Pantoea communis TaxID=2608354 RepID=A0ABX0RWF2_9GAMM|nr:EAL domain-containing protein [Pantoea communis]NIG21287.1 EAL domain-containing protein [Pantoea communis]
MKIAFEPILSSDGKLYAVECLTRAYGKKGEKLNNTELFFKTANGEALNEILNYQLDVIEKNHHFFLNKKIRVSLNLNYKCIEFINPEALRKLNELEMLCLEVDVHDIQFLSENGVEFLNSLNNEIWLDDLDANEEYPHLNLIKNIKSIKIDKYIFWKDFSNINSIEELTEKYTSKNLRVIFEGVETNKQFSTIEKKRLLYAQGYLFEEFFEDSLKDLTLLLSATPHRRDNKLS